MNIIDKILPFLSNPKNYDDVLNKLATFAFYETYIITLFLRSNQSFDDLCKRLELWGPIGKLFQDLPHYNDINLTGIIIRLAVASLTRIFRFHDFISNICGIRRTFDIHHILMPLAQRVDSMADETKLANYRDDLMYDVFYKYASSRAEKPLVDKHLIEEALGAWCWFWTFIEGVAYFCLGAIAAWYFNYSALSTSFKIVAFLLLIFAMLQSKRIPRYTRLEVNSIVSDANARNEIKGRFDAL